MALGIQPGLPADIGQVNNHEHKPKSHYERSGNDIIEKGLSTPIGTIVFDSEKRVNIILASAETSVNSNNLKTELEQKRISDFIDKLKGQTKSKDILDAIEKGTLKVFEIPGRNLVAISLSGKNVDYIYNIDGTQYFDLINRRKDNLKYSVFQGILKDFGLEEQFINGMYLLKDNGTPLETFSHNYFFLLMKVIDKSLEYANILKKLKSK